MGCFAEILEHKQATNLKRHKFSKGLVEVQQNSVTGLNGTWVTGKRLYPVFKLEGYRSSKLVVVVALTCLKFASLTCCCAQNVRSTAP